MKTHYFKQRFSSLASAAMAIWLGGTALTATAAPNSPVGDWDFYFSGGQKGVALITFNGNNTIVGLTYYSPGKVPKVANLGIRGVFTDSQDPRGSGGHTNIYDLRYGGADITGTWGYDLKGKIVGVMTLNSEKSTNGWVIRGAVNSALDKFTITTTLVGGGTKSVLHGAPRSALPDISGTYFQSGSSTLKFTRSSQPFNQILTLTSLTPGNFYYAVDEQGPGYQGAGRAILTRNKYIGIYSEHYTPGSTNTEVIVVSGKFNTNNLTGKVTGFDGTNFLKLQLGNATGVPASSAPR